MGEIADAILEGDLCEICGVYLGEGDGFPRTCTGCGGDADEDLDDDYE
jgi:hypothetical protein